MKDELIKVAVITGGKAFNVIEFHKLFNELKGIKSYIQHIDDFACATKEERSQYDVILFFFMMKEDVPTDDGLPAYCGHPKNVIEELRETSQGIVVLHHALLAYPCWSVWSDIVGIPKRQLLNYKHNETVNIQVENTMNTIIKNLRNWEMIDEIYLMENASNDNDVLLTVNNKNSMESIAWTRKNHSNNVFCFQSGHDKQTWENTNFKTVLERGIKWTVNKI